MKTIASYADGIGPEKRLVVPVNADGTLGAPTDLSRARTPPVCWCTSGRIRIDKEFLPGGLPGRRDAEFAQFRDLGVDGVFTDFPDVAVKSYGPLTPQK